MKKISILYLMLCLILSIGCGEDKQSKGEMGDAAHSASAERNIRRYNLKVEKKHDKKRTPCDTIAIQEYVLENYEEGTYLVEYDRTFTYNVPKPAVIYKQTRNNTYIFALIAKSKKGERFIEKKNIIGYESSFINLDSTKLGTAFFYLTLFECSEENGFNMIWEAEVPIHGGFNYMKYHKGKRRHADYISINFEYGIISGHRTFNFFFIDGIINPPHLLETYEGIAQKRVMKYLNKDKYPDYYEYRFIDTVNYNRMIDSIPFYWDTTKHLYKTPVNKRWMRKY